MVLVRLDTELRQILGAGYAQKITKAFGYHTVRQLLWHLPSKQTPRGQLTTIDNLQIGDNVTVIARVVKQYNNPAQTVQRVTVTDGINELDLIYFRQPWKLQELKPGVSGQFAGKVGHYQGRLQLNNPDYELFNETTGNPTESNFAGRAIPTYPAKQALPSWKIAQLIAQVLAQLAPVTDPLPQEIFTAAKICDLDTALRQIHQPDDLDAYAEATRSLRFREAFALQLGLIKAAADYGAGNAAGVYPAKTDGILASFDAQLPYQLTADQQRVGAWLTNALAQPKPLAALLHGEVGSGKTLVALRAMLQVADSGVQAALLAPTEVLAQQHYTAICELLDSKTRSRVQPVLLTGSLKTAARKAAQLALISGKSLLVVGTHALISDSTNFFDLGFVVIDEQHRFGVKQREALCAKGAKTPHLLALSATPIPRTMALTMFGELELLELRNLPAGRAGITTFAVQAKQNSSAEYHRVWIKILEEIAQGRQAYVICPAIEYAAEQNTDNSKAAVAAVAAALKSRSDYAQVRIAEVTGQTDPELKQQIMADFVAKKIDLLVATTVLEVGINVPNASIMVVLEAERFGVSQLHQLRGRVGRGSLPGICLLVSNVPPNSSAWQRLEAVAATCDGFELAKLDLEQRQEGDILGESQSGKKSTLKTLRVTQDVALLEHTRLLAKQLLAADPQLENAPGLQAELIYRQQLNTA